MQSLRSFQYFSALAGELHFRRAAERLGITQSQLSNAVRDLEKELGVTLLVRDRRKQVQLTPAGVEVTRQAAVILKRMDIAVDLIREAGGIGGDRGKLIVGMAGAMAHGPLPGWIKAFRDRFPSIHIDLRELPAPELERALHSGDLDVGFVHPPVEAARLTAETVASENVVVAFPKGHALAAKKAFVTPGDLRLLPLVSFRRAANPGLFDVLHRSIGSSGVSGQAADLHTVLAFVAAGMGAALVPSGLASPPRPGVVYRPLEGPQGTVKTLAVYRSGTVNEARKLLLASVKS